MDIKVISEDTKNKKALPLGVTAEQLAQWKRRYCEVYFFRVKDKDRKDEVIGAWMRLPSFEVIKLVQDTAKNVGDSDAAEQLYINCKLLASEDIEKNFRYKSSVLGQMEALVKSYETEVVKY